MHKKYADPLKTKTGKTRLGPLSIAKLEEMLKLARVKDRDKIENRIRYLNRLGYHSNKVDQSAEILSQ
jgi:hypothetical protein